MIMDSERSQNNQNNEQRTTLETRIEAALRDYGERAAFSPLFADRLQRRINARANASAQEAAQELARELVWMFRRTLLVGTAVAALLVWYNLSSLPSNERLSLSGMFGVPSDKLDFDDAQEPLFAPD
jgi:hypothetical protein